MPKKKTVLELLQEMGVSLDEHTQKIVKILERGQTVSENKIADKLKLKINTTRKLLYRLNSLGIATYTKKRDEKKKWWYLYFWSLDFDRIRDRYVSHLKKEIENKKQQLEEESKFVFECKPCDRRFTYEDALETEFSCPYCGNLLTEVKGTRIAQRLKREIAVLEQQLSEATKVIPTPKPKPVKAAKPKRVRKKVQKPKKAVKKKPKPRVTKRARSQKKKTTKKRGSSSLAKRVLKKLILRKKRK